MKMTAPHSQERNYMDDEELKVMCEMSGIPTEWACYSVPENPTQIYDQPGYKAIVNANGRIRIYDRAYSAIIPIIDTGSDPISDAVIARLSS